MADEGEDLDLADLDELELALGRAEHVAGLQADVVDAPVAEPGAVAAVEVDELGALGGGAELEVELADGEMIGASI